MTKKIESCIHPDWLKESVWQYSSSKQAVHQWPLFQLTQHKLHNQLSSFRPPTLPTKRHSSLIHYTSNTNSFILTYFVSFSFCLTCKLCCFICYFCNHTLYITQISSKCYQSKYYKYIKIISSFCK